MASDHSSKANPRKCTEPSHDCGPLEGLIEHVPGSLLNKDLRKFPTAESNNLNIVVTAITRKEKTRQS